MALCIEIQEIIPSNSIKFRKLRVNDDVNEFINISVKK